MEEKTQDEQEKHIHHDKNIKMKYQLPYKTNASINIKTYAKSCFLNFISPSSCLSFMSNPVVAIGIKKTCSRSSSNMRGQGTEKGNL